MALRTIELLLHGNAGQAIAEMERLAVATDASSTGMRGKISSLAQTTTLAMAGIGIAVAGVSVKLADDFEKAHALLETAVKNTGGSMKQLEPIINTQEQKFQHLGYTQTQYEQALARGTIGTGNAQKSLVLMSQAADLAAFSHTDLETAMTALVKVTEGKLRPAAQLGIDLSALQASNAKQLAAAHDKVTTAGEALALVQQKINDGHLKGQAATDAAHKAYKALSDAMESLTEKTGGSDAALKAIHQITMNAAEKQAETFAGKVQALQATLENIGIKIGQAVIPVLETLATALSDVIGWFEKNKTAAEALGIAIGTILAAAVSIFVFDKAVAMIAGLQRIGVGLGLLAGESEAAAATVEASGVQMQLGLEAAGAGGVAAGEGGAAAGTGMLAAVGPIALILGATAGLAYGLAQVFGESTNVGLKFQGLATNDVPALTKALETNQGTLDKLNGALDGYGIHVSNASVNHKEFLTVLDKSPASAQAFIDAAHNAGESTGWYTQKLQEHIVAAEESKVAQQRWGIETQIADAKARGDTGAVYGLNLQLMALPTNPQIEIRLSQTGINLGDLGAQIHELTDNPHHISLTIGAPF